MRINYKREEAKGKRTVEKEEDCRLVSDTGEAVRQVRNKARACDGAEEEGGLRVLERGQRETERSLGMRQDGIYLKYHR